MREIGYARVSKESQKLDIQIASLKRYGIKEEDIYTEYYTGKTRNRPVFKELMNEILRPGDKFVVVRLDRLSRNLLDTFSIINELVSRDIEFDCVEMEIDTKSADGKFMIGIMALIAQREADKISEKTAQGIKAAKARGKMPGRKEGSTKVPTKEVHRYVSGFEDIQEGIDSAAKFYGISANTVRKYLKREGVVFRKGRKHK